MCPPLWSGSMICTFAHAQVIRLHCLLKLLKCFHNSHDLCITTKIIWQLYERRSWCCCQHYYNYVGSTLYSSEIRILCLKVCILLEYENAKFFFFHSIIPRHKMFQKYRRNIALGHFIKYITQFKNETMT